MAMSPDATINVQVLLKPPKMKATKALTLAIPMRVSVEPGGQGRLEVEPGYMERLEEALAGLAHL